jgi:hypothetical protein
VIKYICTLRVGGLGAWQRQSECRTHHEVRVSVHAQPVLGVVDVDQVPDQIVVRLADVAALALLWSKHHVVVQRIIHHRITY